MRSLFRMSRTAGVGLQDYAAVNVMAVVGLLLALSSVLVLIFADIPAMLAIPAAAIIVSLIAFIQVTRSNGTQTGKAIALAGVVVALGLGGTNVFGHIKTARKESIDQAAIGQLVKHFSDAALANKAADAYAMFDTKFQESIKLETFERVVTLHVEKTFGGPRLTSIGMGDRFVFETDANGVDFATALITLSADGKTAEGVPYTTDEPAEFRNVDGTWKFRNIPNWFLNAKSSEPAKPGM